jgi:hypothetical protein
MAHPDAALTIATGGDPGARERAWKRLENPAVSRPDDADLSALELSARRRG